MAANQAQGPPPAQMGSGRKAAGQGFNVLITTGKFSREQIETQTRLQLIQTAYAGYDGIDVVAACRSLIRKGGGQCR